MQVVPVTSYSGTERYPSFSPDGRQIAFVGSGERQDNFDVYVKLLGPGNPLRLTKDPAEDSIPGWSPDGRWIAFLRLQSGTTHGVHVIPALGGAERKLGEVESPILPNFPAPLLTWTPDGKLLILVDHSLPEEPFSLYLMSVESGQKRRLTHAPRSSYGDSSPAISPDGRTLAFVRLIPGFQVYLQSLTEDFQTREEPRLLTREHWGVSKLNWTRDGRSLLCVDWKESDRGIWRIPVSPPGRPQSTAALGGSFRHLTISRQGDQLAYTQVDQHSDIWRLDLRPSVGGRREPVRLISSTRIEADPQYSPDGNRIAFESHRWGHSEIWVADSDGSNPVRLTYLDGPSTGSPSWSPDGKEIVFDVLVEGNTNLYVIRAGGGKPRRLTTDRAQNVVARWSRDGQWIYLSSNRTSGFQIWKVPSRGGDAIQVTRNGSDRMVFESADGKVLYYRKGGAGWGSVWRVPATGGEEIKILDAVWKRDFYVLEDGIYFISEQRPAETYTVQFYSFRTRSTKRLAEINQVVATSFSVSPDRRWLVYWAFEQRGGDIMMVENFR